MQKVAKVPLKVGFQYTYWQEGAKDCTKGLPAALVACCRFLTLDFCLLPTAYCLLPTRYSLLSFLSFHHFL